MLKDGLKNRLKKGDTFVVCVELTGGFGYNFAPIEKFLADYQNSGDSALPAGFSLTAVTVPQNPGGVANIEPADVFAQLEKHDLLKGLDFLPHVTCKDQNSSAITSSLVGFEKFGVSSVLAMTGDKPATAKGVFELDSIGLMQLIRKMNNDSYLKAKPENLSDSHQFFIGGAVSPFKYTQASQMQQYYKMEKKIKSGVDFFITQVGWDWKKSAELARYMKDNKIDTPVIGNVYLLSTITPAPRLMHDIKLPGCFVSDELLEKVYSESVDDHIERAAQQIAMYKQLGYAGVDVGGVHDFNMFKKILARAAAIGDGWQQFKDNLCWPAKDAWYLYDDNGKKAQLTKFSKKMNQRTFDMFHRCILDADHKGFHVFKKTMEMLGTKKGKGFFYKGFNACEKAAKYILFDCQECGDCFLPENFSWCTIGGCEKGMDNAPCGDSTADGRCGNNLDRICIGEYIYKAASAKKGGLEKLRRTVNPSRDPALEHSSSILNYLFGKDHTMKNPLITIGESIHASIPKTGKIMKELAALGDDCYSKPSPGLDYIKALIESQAAEGADYIAVNLDEFGETDPQATVDIMVEYVKMVRNWGAGVPICIDSSSDDVLIAGLKEWYNTTESVKQPLVNSIKDHNIEKLMPLKKHFDFSFIGLLVSEGKESVNELHKLARQIFDAAIKYGFKPGEIFFDTTVFPLAIDMPMEPGKSGYTYRAFETIKKIKNDPAMKGVHFSLGVSNSVRDLPARKIGVVRAYVEKAMEYGLDAGIVNSAHKFGQIPADQDLVKLVEAFAKLDGNMENLNNAMMLMGDFCSKNRKPA